MTRPRDQTRARLCGTKNQSEIIPIIRKSHLHTECLNFDLVLSHRSTAMFVKSEVELNSCGVQCIQEEMVNYSCTSPGMPPPRVYPASPSYSNFSYLHSPDFTLPPDSVNSPPLTPHTHEVFFPGGEAKFSSEDIYGMLNYHDTTMVSVAVFIGVAFHCSADLILLRFVPLPDFIISASHDSRIVISLE